MTETQMRGAVPQFGLGDRLGKALDHAEMSNKEMAIYLEVSPNTIGNYIAERTKADKRTLMLWAMRTGVDLDWLRTGEESKGTDPRPPSQDGRRQAALADLTRKKRMRGRENTDR